MSHEIHEHDSLLCVGETPWHGLGLVVDTPPESAAEALEMAKIDWEVEKQPIYDRNQQPVAVNTGTKRNEGLWGITVRKDLPEDNPDRILGVVGPKYVPFQNSQMAQLFEPLVKEGKITIETCGSLFNGKRVWMLGRFGEDTVIDRKDVVRKHLLFSHGHDGSFAARIGFTPTRVVCWNTLSAAVYDGESKLVRCLHTANLENNLRTLRDTMNAAEETFEMTAEEYRKLTKKGVSRADLNEYARILIDADEDPQKWTFRQKEKMVAIVSNAIEGRGNNGSTWWDAYNGVTEYITWQACRTPDTRLSEAWFGKGMDLNNTALKLAVEMSA